MISILVPIFNVDATDLIRTLQSQLVALNSNGELIVIDDGSDASYRSLNKELQAHTGIRYIELPQNIGRLEIRKLLAKKAKFEWLLFLDGDSQILQHHFLETYLQSFSKGYDVVVGGRKYSQQPPLDCIYKLHWKYGTKREDLIHRKTGFMTNNFCIKKEVFQKLQFDLPWQGYGHEDTWIGIQLESLGAKIRHIENYVYHNGVEPCDVFLKKSARALENLQLLASRYDAAILQKHVRLFHYYWFFKKTPFSGLVVKLFKLFQKPIIKNLCSCRPSLYLFDFYRLCIFIKLQRLENKTITTHV